MDMIFSLISLDQLLICFVIAFVAGVIKGMVGFALPMILISGLSSVISPELALAGLILPTVVTNVWQALRQGFGAAWKSAQRFRVYLALVLVAIFFSAQLVRVLPPNVMLLLIGVPVSFFAILQLLGYQLRMPEKGQKGIEAAIALFAGFVGGLSGVWGPPTVLYLTALETPKDEQLRIQGVIYGIGALALLGAHVSSGVVRADTLSFSVMLLVPALIGASIGFRLHDRIDQVAFKRATLIVLLVAALNLVRRALTWAD